MEKDETLLPEKTIESWRTHLSVSSGSEHSEEPSSRGSSPAAAEVHQELWRLYRGQRALLEETGRAALREELEAQEAQAAQSEDQSEASASADESSDLEEEDEHSLHEDDTLNQIDPDDISPGDLSSPHTLTDTDPIVRHIQNQEARLQEHILHSPRPQRNYRPTVTSGMEPSPLPLYDQTVPPFYYSYPGPWPHSPGYPLPNPHLPHGHMYYPNPAGSPEGGEPPLRMSREDRKLAGYELLASKLSRASREDLRDAGPIPLYRRFEALNHRILLHLQDEISEMEEELNILDEDLAEEIHALSPSTKVSKGQGSPPASRRADARLGGERHFRRTELLGRIFLKLGQYSKSAPSQPQVSCP
jgi:hypothetical protein